MPNKIIKECRRCYKRYGTWTGAEIPKDFGFCRTCLRERQELRGDVPRSMTGRQASKPNTQDLPRAEKQFCPRCGARIALFGGSNIRGVCKSCAAATAKGSRPKSRSPKIQDPPSPQPTNIRNRKIRWE